MPTSEPYPGTQAVLRALTLLKAFTDEQPELSLAELAQGARLNKTTTYRLLTALESEGLVARTGDTDTYRLGPEAIVLGGRAMRANNLREVCRPELETLARQTREAATVEMLSEGEVLTLDEVSGGYLVGAAQSVGTHWPLYATSTGKVLLAHLPETELDRLLQFPLTSFTTNTITTAEALHRELEQIRERGYALANEELEVGFIAIGAPIRNHNGQVVAAISVGGPRARLTQDKILEFANLVMQAAGRISARLGYVNE
jgi:DNA-binding IclR family transcriptional regulator